MSKIGVVLPVYRSEDYENKKYNIYNLIDTLINIRKVDNLEFLINFQNFSKEEVNRIIKRLEKTIDHLNTTWSYKYTEKSYDSISMVIIRNDCMLLDRECDYYLWIDDDISLGENTGECYNRILNFMESDKSLGVVMSAGYLGGYFYKEKLNYHDDFRKHIWTNRGLFIRNIRGIEGKSPVYLDPYLDCIGGLEELPVLISVASYNLRYATDYNNKAYHKSNYNEGVGIHNFEKSLDRFISILENEIDLDTSKFNRKELMKFTKNDLSKICRELRSN